jgi:hypothetical protein
VTGLHLYPSVPYKALNLYSDKTSEMDCSSLSTNALIWGGSSTAPPGRLAIGIGPIDFLPQKAISSGDGEAYRRSRDAQDVLVRLIDAIARDSTGRQANAVCGAILDWKQVKIASVWFKGAVTQQAVAQHLERAGWNAAAEALAHIEDSWLAEPDGCRTTLGVSTP